MDALKIKPCSKPFQGIEGASRLFSNSKIPENNYKLVEKFTDMILNHIVLKIQRYEQNHKSICSDNIHYRITYFFSKSNINPKSCRIFNGWVLKQITNQKISLKKAILKQDELSGNFTKCIVYCKNMQFKEKCNI